MPIITAPYVARALGVYNVGVFTYTQSAANYFYLFSMLGVNNYGNRRIAQVRDNKELLKTTFWEIVSIQLFATLIMSALYVCYCRFFVNDFKLIYLLQLLYVISGAFDVNWFCFGIENFKLTTIRSTVIRLLMTGAIFVFVHTSDDLWIYTLIISCGMLISVLAIWPYVLKQVGFVKPKLKKIQTHIKPNLVLFWPVIAISFYNLMDKLMLGFFSTKDEVAYYTYALRIIEIPLTLILALDTVIMPRMSNLYAGKAEDKTIKLFDQVMLFSMFMCAGMAFGLAGVGENFAPWFYGDSFTRCGFFIVILSPILIFKGWASAIRTQFIIPTGRDKIYVISLSIGAVVNFVLNILLIPQYEGVGAIIGTIAAEFCVCFIQFYLSRDVLSVKNYIFEGIGFCLIGLIMYLPVVFLSNIVDNKFITLIIQVSVGVVIYLLLSVIYMVKILKKPFLVDYALKYFHIKK